MIAATYLSIRMQHTLQQLESLADVAGNPHWPQISALPIRIVESAIRSLDSLDEIATHPKIDRGLKQDVLKMKRELRARLNAFAEE